MIIYAYIAFSKVFNFPYNLFTILSLFNLTQYSYFILKCKRKYKMLDLERLLFVFFDATLQTFRGCAFVRKICSHNSLSCAKKKKISLSMVSISSISIVSHQRKISKQKYRKKVARSF